MQVNQEQPFLHLKGLLHSENLGDNNIQIKGGYFIGCKAIFFLVGGMKTNCLLLGKGTDFTLYREPLVLRRYGF